MIRRTALRRRTWLKARGDTKYRRRERDLEFMTWVRRQPCIMRELPASDVLTFCSGPVEADHMGARGLGQKADDGTCVPMCRGHHRERTDHAGTFRPLTRDELRAWRAVVIERTQDAWRNRCQ